MILDRILIGIKILIPLKLNKAALFSHFHVPLDEVVCGNAISFLPRYSKLFCCKILVWFAIID